MVSDAWEEFRRAYDQDALPVDDPDARSVALMRAVLAGAGDLTVALLLRWNDGRFTSFPEQPVRMKISGSDRLVNESEVAWEEFDPIDPFLIDWGVSSVRLLGDGEELARLSLARTGQRLLLGDPVTDLRLGPGGLVWNLRSP